MRLYEFNDRTEKIARQFITWVCEKLDITDPPKVILDKNKAKVDKNRSFGSTEVTDGSIWVYIDNRNTADSLRTLAHEMVHYKQFLDGVLNDLDDDKKQQIEDEANAIAGRLMREYGKINVDIYENKSGSLQDASAESLPGVYVVPGLKNQDPYMQYRFGVALAGAKGAERRKEDNITPFSKETSWGENQIIVGYGDDVEKYVDDALKQIGIKGKKRVSGNKSEEPKDTKKYSPIKPFKGY